MMYSYRQRRDVEPEELARLQALQHDLRQKLRLEPLPAPPRLIGGADISYNLAQPDVIYAGMVVLDAETLQPLAHSLLETKTDFPYIPGFLSFREAPALQAVWEQLPLKPDVLIVDGHGIAHPRRLGIATHLGILLDIPTMGCAKKRLIGKYEEPEENRGSYSLLSDKGEELGYVYRSRSKVKPVFLSPGNRMSLEDCLKLMPLIEGKYRLPEPTRQAHGLVNRFRSGQLAGGAYRY